MTDPPLMHKTVFLEKDVKTFRAQLQKQVRWHARYKADGSIISGQLPEKNKPVVQGCKNKPGPFLSFPVDGTPKTIPADMAPSDIVTVSGPVPQSLTQHPGNIVITKGIRVTG